MPKNKPTTCRRSRMHCELVEKTPSSFSTYYHSTNIIPALHGQDPKRRIQDLFCIVRLEASKLEVAVDDSAREKGAMVQEIENLQERCRTLEWKMIKAREQLASERAKWPSAFLQAIRDRSNAYCDGCHFQSSMVHLTQCFHLLCEACYKEDQGPVPEAPNSSRVWMCKACCSLTHTLYTV